VAENGVRGRDEREGKEGKRETKEGKGDPPNKNPDHGPEIITVED